MNNETTRKAAKTFIHTAAAELTAAITHGSDEGEIRDWLETLQMALRAWSDDAAACDVAFGVGIADAAAAYLRNA